MKTSNLKKAGYGKAPATDLRYYGMTFLAFVLMENKGLDIDTDMHQVVTNMLGQTQLCRKWLLMQLNISQDNWAPDLNVSFSTMTDTLISQTAW